MPPGTAQASTDLHHEVQHQLQLVDAEQTEVLHEAGARSEGCGEQEEVHSVRATSLVTTSPGRGG